MRQAQHPMLPHATHDEEARQHFALALREEAVAEARIGGRTVFEKRVEPDFRRRVGRKPKNRHEVRKAMLKDPYGQMTSAVRLLAQEIMWDSVGVSIERQLDDLIAKALRLGSAGTGSLRLDPTLAVPRYVGAVDIHGMPGNYDTDLCRGDVFAGALYDRGVFLRSMGSAGAYNDNFGHTCISYLKKEFPRFQPRRILDVGCSVGHSTLPFCDAYPKAEVHAIDTGAPLLRYAHARAVALGKAVHFSQKNAEHTDFPDGHFDLIVGLAMLHETSTAATRNILKEAHRLLVPGGIVLHFEGPPWNRISDFDAAVHDWDTHFNAEPFISKVHDLDPKQLMRDAGFRADRYIDVNVTAAFRGTSSSLRGAMWFFGARK
ncbi:MAG: class I SAM-dependent methyltransferase [Alphaproteobacteria bacterium]|nr:class I SAM-dependent methyltransferase [Alphaproteobacteria bacterium]